MIQRQRRRPGRILRVSLVALSLLWLPGAADAVADGQDEARDRRPEVRVRLLSPSDGSADATGPRVRSRLRADGSFVIPIRRSSAAGADAGRRLPTTIVLDGGQADGRAAHPVGVPPRDPEVPTRDRRAPSSASERPERNRADGSLFSRLLGPGDNAAGDAPLASGRGDGASEVDPVAPPVEGSAKASQVTATTAGATASSSPVTTARPRISSATDAGTDETARAARRPAAVDGDSYRLGPGDTVDVFVWRDPDLSRQVPVRPDGRISLPLLGEIEAAGRTPAELEAIITDALSEYVQMPSVTVSVTQIRSLVVYVVGNVATPGPLTLDREVNVLQALAMAGGLNEFADEGDIVVIRKGEDGREKRFPFDYSDVVEGDRPELNIALRAGDIVYVP